MSLSFSLKVLGAQPLATATLKIVSGTQFSVLLHKEASLVSIQISALFTTVEDSYGLHVFEMDN